MVGAKSTALGGAIRSKFPAELALTAPAEDAEGGRAAGGKIGKVSPAYGAGIVYLEGSVNHSQKNTLGRSSRFGQEADTVPVERATQHRRDALGGPNLVRALAARRATWLVDLEN